jgi:hypothetical protein
LSWFLIVATLVVARPASSHPDGSYPRTFNLDWRNTINATYDSRYDVIVTSTRVQNDQLDSLRMLNPSITRLMSLSWYMYYNAGPSGYPADWGPFDPADPVVGWDRRYWDLLEDNDWWLYGRDSIGVRYRGAVFWDTWTGNFSTKCPPNAQGQRLCDVFADYLIDNLVSQKSIEGLFFDNCWDGPNHLHWQMWGACPSGTDCTDPAVPRTPETEFYVGFDLDTDGTADHPDSLRQWWSDGIRIVLNRLRQRMGPDFVLVGNGALFYETLNGMMYERFPRIFGQYDPEPNPAKYKWYDNTVSTRFGYLGHSESFFSTSRYNLIDTEHPRFDQFQAQTSSTREKFKRWTLGTTLLGDGYYTAHGPTYTDLWWEPEYDLQLGWPVGDPYTLVIDGREIWKRDFSRGEVWVNPTAYNIVETATNPAIGYWDAVIRESTTSAPLPGGGGLRISMETPWPNPTTAGAAIRFRLPASADASLVIFDTAGRLVRHLWTGIGSGIPQTAIWDGKHEMGFEVPAGVYFATLSSGGETAEARLVRIR